MHMKIKLTDIFRKMLVKHLIHILDFSHIFSFPDPNNSYYYFVKIWNRLFFPK